MTFLIIMSYIKPFISILIIFLQLLCTLKTYLLFFSSQILDHFKDIEFSLSLSELSLQQHAE
ncbi:hypothetical protein X975_20068, partial [Stegodyphus mimosarum]